MNRTANVLLWILQVVLGALFIFSGVFKLITPTQTLAQQAHMSGTFLHFIGVLETLGGLGLVLPWLLRIKPALTPIAAACLVGIMIGAVAVTIKNGPVAMVWLPALTGVLCAVVAFFRSRDLSALKGVRTDSPRTPQRTAAT